MYGTSLSHGTKKKDKKERVSWRKGVRSAFLLLLLKRWLQLRFYFDSTAVQRRTTVESHALESCNVTTA